VRAVPRLCEFYPGICLTTEEKARKNLSQGKENLSQVNKNLCQCTVHILPKHPNKHTVDVVRNKLKYFSCLSRWIWTFLFLRNLKFSNFLCISRLLAKPLAIFCPAMVGRHWYRKAKNTVYIYHSTWRQAFICNVAAVRWSLCDVLAFKRYPLNCKILPYIGYNWESCQEARDCRNKGRFRSANS